MDRLGKAIVLGLLLVAAYYSVFGGEYSLFELRSARAAVQTERATTVQLQDQIDSLLAWTDSLQSDSATLERVARERFGLIREGETLYRFATPTDSIAPAESDEAESR